MLAVLSHHLYQKNGLFERTIVAVYLQAFGFLAVAEFFFLSGYGLTKSYKAQEKAYLNRFLQQRVLPYYSVMVLLVFVYGIEKIFLGIALDKKMSFYHSSLEVRLSVEDGIFRSSLFYILCSS